MYLHCLDLFQSLYIETISWWNKFLLHNTIETLALALLWKGNRLQLFTLLRALRVRANASIVVDSCYTNTRFRHREPPTTRTHWLPSTSPSYLGLRYTSQTYNVVQSNSNLMLNTNSSDINLNIMIKTFSCPQGSQRRLRGCLHHGPWSRPKAM
jgi:hypothetical protein